MRAFPAMKSIVFLCALLVTSFHLAAPAEGQGWVGRDGSGQASDTKKLGTGTVQYDPGTPADSLLPGPALLIGNRFDSRSGAPLSPGTVTAIAAYWGGQDATFPVLAILNTANTGIYGVAYAGSQVPYQFNTFALAAPVPSVFMGIVLASSNYVSSADAVGMRSASTNGQGFHAVTAANAFGSPFNNVAGQNAMVRVSGTVVVPVELMEFDVD